jgi:hypothetical protein
MLSQQGLLFNDEMWYNNSPMKKGTRRILFCLAVAVFGAASWVAVILAQGYTYDFSRYAFVRTGGIAVTANTDADLYVNDRQADAMSFLSHRAGMGRLAPGTYTIRVVRDGYSSWHKTVTVQEGLLTDFPSVLLLPIDPTASASVQEDIAGALKGSTTLPKKTKEVTVDDITLRGTTLYRTVKDQQVLVAPNVLGFQLADNHSRIVWWTSNEVWVQWLTSTDYQPYRLADEKHLITRFSVPIARAAFLHDHDHIVVDMGSGAYRVLETDTRGGINIVSI